jgi:hypothetical protein
MCQQEEGKKPAVQWQAAVQELTYYKELVREGYLDVEVEMVVK